LNSQAAPYNPLTVKTARKVGIVVDGQAVRAKTAGKLDRKRQPSFVYRGLGFPVVLTDVPMVRSLGVWTPDVDYRKLMREVLRLLALRPSKLTVREARFVRHSTERPS
jgi:hypothetical protein